MKKLLKKLTVLDEADIQRFIYSLANISNQTVTLGFLNQHACNLAFKDNSLKKNLLELNYLLRDGVGVRLACHYFKIKPGENLNGTDLIPMIIDHCESVKHNKYIVYGTRNPWLDLGAKKLFNCNDYISLDGFQTEKAYIKNFSDLLNSGDFSDKKLTVVILAMGMPKQEDIAIKLSKVTMGFPTLIICGGAIIDFNGQRFSRAPVLFRKFGLEWIYRFSCEPTRLFGRYVIGVPLFIYRILKS